MISKFMKRIIGCSLLMIMTTCTLGCEPQENKVMSSYDITDTVRLSWWGNDARHAYTMDAVSLFEEENKDINVDYRYGEWSGYGKRNKVWMESHTQADVMQINYAWLADYSPDGLGYYDLYQLSDVIDFDNFTEEDLAYGEVNGKLNAIPIAFNTSVVYHNKSIYDKYGLEVPVTWDDYFEAAKVMSKDDIYPLGLGEKHMFLMLIAYYEQTTGKPAFDEDGSFLLQETDIEVLVEFYNQLLVQKVIMPFNQFDKTKFTGGEVASSSFWVSDAGTYCDELDSKGVEIELGEYPGIEDPIISGRYIKPATMYAISNITSNPEASGKLLNFLLNSDEMAELQKTEKGVPVSKSAVKYLEEHDGLGTREYEATQKMLSERDRMKVMIPTMEDEAVIGAFKSGAEEYFYGKMSVKEAAAMIYENINSIINGTEDEE